MGLYWRCSSPDGVHLLRRMFVLALPLKRPLVPLLSGIGGHAGSIFGTQDSTTCLPSCLHSRAKVLDETGRSAVEMGEIGSASIALFVAFDGHAMQLAVHLRRPV